MSNILDKILDSPLLLTLSLILFYILLACTLGGIIGPISFSTYLLLELIAGISISKFVLLDIPHSVMLGIKFSAIGGAAASPLVALYFTHKINKPLSEEESNRIQGLLIYIQNHRNFCHEDDKEKHDRLLLEKIEQLEDLTSDKTIFNKFTCSIIFIFSVCNYSTSINYFYIFIQKITVKYNNQINIQPNDMSYWIIFITISCCITYGIITFCGSMIFLHLYQKYVVILKLYRRIFDMFCLLLYGILAGSIIGIVIGSFMYILLMYPFLWLLSLIKFLGIDVDIGYAIFASILGIPTSLLLSFIVYGYVSNIKNFLIEKSKIVLEALEAEDNNNNNITEDSGVTKKRWNYRWLIATVIVPIVIAIITTFLQQSDPAIFVIENPVLSSKESIIIKAKNRKANRKHPLDLSFDGYLLSEACVAADLDYKQMQQWYCNLNKHKILDSLKTPGEHCIKVSFPGEKLSGELKILIK